MVGMFLNVWLGGVCAATDPLIIFGNDTAGCSANASAADWRRIMNKSAPAPLRVASTMKTVAISTGSGIEDVFSRLITTAVPTSLLSTSTDRLTFLPLYETSRLWLPVRMLENVTLPLLSVFIFFAPLSVTSAPCTGLPVLSLTSTINGTTATGMSSALSSLGGVDGVGVGVAEGLGVGVGVAEADGDGFGCVEGLLPPDDGDDDGDGDGEGDGEGDGGGGGAVIGIDASVLLNGQFTTPKPCTTVIVLTSLMATELPAAPDAFNVQSG